MNKGRLMGIDQGLKRIGVAVSDPTWLVAKELTIIIAKELTIITRTSKQADFARLQQIITEQKVAALIVGIPTKHLPPMRSIPRRIRSAAGSIIWQRPSHCPLRSGMNT